MFSENPNLGGGLCKVQIFLFLKCSLPLGPHCLCPSSLPLADRAIQQPSELVPGDMAEGSDFPWLPSPVGEGSCRLLPPSHL